MAILAECDICGHQHRIKDVLVGRTLRCKECNVQIVVPDGPNISPETFIEEDGRLRRREQDVDRSRWPWLMAALGSTLVLLVLIGVIWAIISIGTTP